jgi:hypothetical protein
VAGKRAATVNWVQADNTGAAVVSQTVQVWSGGNIVGSAKVSATATSALLKLRAGVSYSFTVVATNSIATSLQSPMSNLVIPTNK